MCVLCDCSFARLSLCMSRVQYAALSARQRRTPFINVVALNPTRPQPNGFPIPSGDDACGIAPGKAKK